VLATNFGTAAAAGSAVAAMTATTISENEGEPATWPAGVADVDRHVWKRIESWIARRWSSRGVTYVAEGPGWWRARLYPFSVSTTERWEAGAWIACTLDATPLGGLELPGTGPYRIAGTAGDDAELPYTVVEAFRRLRAYGRQARPSAALVAKQMLCPEQAHALSDSLQEVAQDGRIPVLEDWLELRPIDALPPTWLARAMSLSGAADLLRPYRRMGAS
jgi:hypothetical protein